MARLTPRQRTAVGAAAIGAVLLGGLAAAAAVAQSNDSPTPGTPPATDGALLRAANPSPTVTVTTTVVGSPSVTVPRTITVSVSTSKVTVTRTATATVTVARGTTRTTIHTTVRPTTINAGTGGQAEIGGLSPGAAALGIAGVSTLAAGGAVLTRRRTGTRL